MSWRRDAYRLLRIGTVVVVLSGAALWWATGRWQWPVTLFAVLEVAAQGHIAFNVPKARAAWPQAWKTQPIEPLSSDVVVWCGWVAFVAGLVGWAWTGTWALAIAGVGVFGGLIGVTAVVQHRRGQLVVSLIEKARDDPDQAIPAYERVVAMYPGDPPSELRYHIAFATYHLARLQRGSAAVAAYERLITRFREDSDPAIRKIIERALAEGPPPAV